jgi:hypothetical protein
MPDYEFQETFSVNKVREFCALSKHLSGQDIRYNDKSISWDGNIIYFSESKGLKKGKEYFIPVQIKGKKVKGFRDRASFRIKKIDLDNYFNNKGVIFFLGESIENGVTRLYAKLLLQVDIIRLLSNNKNKKTISVELEYINDVMVLEEMCNVYIANFNSQSILVYNPNILRNFTDFLDSQSEQISFNISLSSDANKYRPEVAMLRSRFAYFYLNRDGIKIPLNVEQKNVAVKYEEKIHFSIPDIYEDDLLVEFIYSSDSTEVVIQKLFRQHIETGKKSVTLYIENGYEYDFNIVYKASKFIVNFLTYYGMLMDNSLIIEEKELYNDICQHFNKPQLLQYHKYIIQLGEILEKLNISKDYFITKELLDDSNRLIELYNLLTHRHYVNISDKSKETDIGKYDVANRTMIIQANRNCNGKYEAKDLFSEPWGLMISEGENILGKPSCYWLYIEPQYISDCLIDRDKMLDDLSKCENLCSDPLVGRIMEYVLVLIKDYDISKRRRNLDFADNLLKISIDCFGTSDCEIINFLQIKKRIKKLEDIDKEKLIVIKNSRDVMAACCACVLLEQWDEYRNIFLNFTVEQQEAFKSWPIYNLVPENYKDEIN